jgi:hypothetical protein
VRRVVLGLVVMAILEAASYGTVLAISSVKPESLIVRSSRVTLYHSSDCVPYWMVWAHVSCPST